MPQIPQLTTNGESALEIDYFLNLLRKAIGFQRTKS